MRFFLFALLFAGATAFVTNAFPPKTRDNLSSALSMSTSGINLWRDAFKPMMPRRRSFALDKRPAEPLVVPQTIDDVVENLMTDLDNMFVSPMGMRKNLMMMSIDVKESKNEYMLKVDLPGCRKEDIKVEILPDNMLMISATRDETEESDDEKVHRVERFRGNAMRSFGLPPDVIEDQISSTFNNGVLEVKLPKMESKEPQKDVPSKVIPVK